MGRGPLTVDWSCMHISTRFCPPPGSPPCSLPPDLKVWSAARDWHPWTACKAYDGAGHDQLKQRQLRAVPFEACQLAFASGINGVCFDRECAEAADRVFAAVIAAPLFGLFCAIIYALRPGAEQEVRQHPCSDLP